MDEAATATCVGYVMLAFGLLGVCGLGCMYRGHSVIGVPLLGIGAIGFLVATILLFLL